MPEIREPLRGKLSIDFLIACDTNKKLLEDLIFAHVGSSVDELKDEILLKSTLIDHMRDCQSLSLTRIAVHCQDFLITRENLLNEVANHRFLIIAVQDFFGVLG